MASHTHRGHLGICAYLVNVVPQIAIGEKQVHKRSETTKYMQHTIKALQRDTYMQRCHNIAPDSYGFTLGLILRIQTDQIMQCIIGLFDNNRITIKNDVVS